jgi:hypothetical protein
MFDWPTPVQPLSIVKTLFWASVFTATSALAADRWLHRALKEHWKFVLALTVVVVIWRIPTSGSFFHGLEYEDSYVYTVAGRQIHEHVSSTGIAVTAPYSIQVCEIGSLKACDKWEAFPEHFIGYPYIIAVFSDIAGYSPAIGSLVNLLAACVSGVTIFGIVLLATENVTMGRAAAVVFAITPVFAVYGLETSAEPASNLCVTLVIWFFMRSVQMAGTLPSRLTFLLPWCAYTSALLFSLMVKRENILMALFLPLLAPLVVPHHSESRAWHARSILLMFVSSTLALLLSAKMHLLHTTSSEAAVLKEFPLNPARLVTFVMGFLRSFFVFDWYGGTVFAVMLGMIVSWRRKGLCLVPLCLFTAYVLLYAAHIRGYYEMRLGHVEPASALRFSMSLMSLWSVVAGVGVGAVMATLPTVGRHISKRTVTGIKWVSLAGVLGISFVVTRAIRNDAVEDETQVRLAPAFSALDHVSSDGSEFIVSLEPLVIQMYADPASHVVDLAAIDSSELRTMMSPGKSDRLVLIDEANRQSEADMERYGNQFRYLESLSRKTLYSARGYDIIRLERR